MKYIDKLKIITQNLEKCKRVTKHSTRLENQADTLANILIDIEDSIRKIEKHIVELYANDLGEDKVDDIVLEIGEELRHIIYHINDTKVYNYLK